MVIVWRQGTLRFVVARTPTVSAAHHSGCPGTFRPKPAVSPLKYLIFSAPPARESKRRGLRQRLDSAGLTLIELLVVIVVLTILATLVAPNVFRHIGVAKESTARTQIEMLGAALDAHRLDVGRYPSSAEGLEALVREPADGVRGGSWRGPYLRKGVPLDPWGNPYVYRSPGEGGRPYDLLSLGADGRPGGTGDDADLASWQ
jgi:general secretion pathway protein G